MKTKAKYSLHPEDFYPNRQENPRYSPYQGNWNQDRITFPRKVQKTGKGILSGSRLKRLEEAGATAWEIQRNDNLATLQEITQRRLVKLKLPSQVLEERNKMILEQPKRGEMGESFISGNQHILDSTAANEINLSTTSFNFSRGPVPQSNQPEERFGISKSQISEFSSQSENNVFQNSSQSLTQSQEITIPDQISSQPKSDFNLSVQSRIEENKMLINNPVQLHSSNMPEKRTGLFGQTTNTSNTNIVSSSFGGAKPELSIFSQKETVQENLPKSTGGLTQEPKIGLFGSNISVKPTGGLFSGNKPEDKKEEPKIGLFSNDVTPKPSGGLFSNQTKPVEEIKEPPKTSIFGSNTTPQISSGFLSGITKPAEEKVEQTKGGLFGSNISQTSGGLFSGNIKPVEEKKEESKIGLFGSNVLATQKAMFGGPTSVEKIEEKKESPKGGLFGSNLSQPSGGIFSTITKPTEEKREEPKASIFGSSVSATQKSTFGGFVPEEKPAQKTEPFKGGLFSSNISQTSGVFSSTAKPVEEKREEPKGGLFSSNIQQTSGLLSKTPVEEKKEEPRTGLFGSNALTSQKAMFGGLTPVEKVEEKKESPKGGLFSSNLSQPSGGIFSTITKPTEEKREEPKTSIFGSNVPTTQKPFFGGLTSNNKPEEKREESRGGLFSSNIQQAPGGLFTSNQKPDEKKEELKSGLFGSNPTPGSNSRLLPNTKPESSSMLIETKQMKPATTEGSGSKPALFSSILSTKPSVTTSPAKKEEKETPKINPHKDEKATPPTPNLPKPGYFSSFGTAKPTENLFSSQLQNTKGSSEKAEENKKPGLFGSSTSTPGTTGLFYGNPQPAAAPGLFSKNAPPQDLFSKDYKSNLFGNQPSGKFSSSLFGKDSGNGPESAKKAENNNSGSEDEDEGDGDDDPERSLSPEADVTKSKVNYEYKQNYDKIISEKVNKFKPGTKSLLPTGEVSLNRMNETNYFIIYRNKAKIIQYQGQLIKKLSATSYLNTREDALSVTTVSEEKGPDGAKLSKDVLKIMFEAPEQCQKFKKAIDQAMN